MVASGTPEYAPADTEIERVFTLKEAVETFFPGGTWTVTSLRTEIRKGRLRPMRIAGKLCVTASSIREMLAQCRERPVLHVSTSGPDRAEVGTTSSSIVDENLALAAARMSANRLKSHSRVTSQRSTGHRKRAAR